MRLIYLAILVLLISSVFYAHAKESDDNGIAFSEFTLYSGDTIDIGDYTAELIEIQSVRDGLAVMKVSKVGGRLDEQRAFLVNSANSFDGGAEDGGLTITVTDIFDDQSAKVRVEYLKDMGTPTKHAAEGGQRTTGVSPDLTVQKSFDKTNLSVGDEVKVTVTVKNIGTDTASNIQVEDLPPISEFSYIAGYPPKIKETLNPGESDYAVYVMDAVKEGSVKVPAIEVTYSDSKKNSKSNTSQPFDALTAPKSKPNIEILLHGPAPMKDGDKGILNVSVINTGNAPATSIQIQSDIAPQDGLALTGVDRTIPRIDPGGMENYSAQLVGTRSGNYTISLKASFQDGEATMLSECRTDVAIQEREYKYLYYLLIIPIIAIALLVFKRYREYKY
jgi:uncharacterized repeat protein (TIGR01451 family)